MQREPSTLSRDISPPAIRKLSRATPPTSKPSDSTIDANPTLAAIEAGQAEITDHLEYFAKHLEQARRSYQKPSLSIDAFRALYQRNEHKHGRHFVVHQHDHPISGVHYDLRLQFSESSTVSFAVPYGLPGNPDSSRPNRMAIETRVHNLWNNLIESASHDTGSLLIWDTGEYEVLPRETRPARTTDDEASPDDDVHTTDPEPSHSERLRAAFRRRHISLRLHGARLPPNYTVSLRLPLNNDRAAQPRKPKRKRRRLDPADVKSRRAQVGTDSEGNDFDHPAAAAASNDPPVQVEDDDNRKDDRPAASTSATEAAKEKEDATIHATNAYPGATNNIGSIHQRQWFLRLDRRCSGLTRDVSSGRWEGGGNDGGWEPFFVRGREVERSIVTGRSAAEVLRDHGVKGFVGRGLWRGVAE